MSAQRRGRHHLRASGSSAVSDRKLRDDARRECGTRTREKNAEALLSETCVPQHVAMPLNFCVHEATV